MLIFGLAKKIRVGSPAVFAGQASTELLALLGIMLLGVLAFAVLSSNLLFDVGAQKDRNTALEAVQKLATAADSVYAQGDGASETVRVTIPQSATLSGGKSYIGRPFGAPADSSANTINLHVQGSDQYVLTSAPLSGSFPALPGNHHLKVISHGSYVSIGSGIVEVSPSSVYLSGRRNEPVFSALQLIVPEGSQQQVFINVFPLIQHGNVQLSVFPSDFSTLSSAEVDLTFLPGIGAAGLYNWELIVNASTNPLSCGQDCRSDYFSIPITMEVQEG